ncbi:MAG: MurR/RpiR family transcriptional regulator [Longicatena sp.]
MSVLIKLREFRNLPSAENEVRKFVLKNAKKVLTMTVYDVAKESYTSPATVVRLCKKLETKGFNQFKILLAAEINAFDFMNLELLDTTNILKNDTPTTIVDKITNIAIQSIEETRILANISELKEVAEKLLSADIIDLFGVGASNIVALDATYKFMRIGKNVSCYQLSDRQYVQAVNSSSNHIGIIFSYSGETLEMIKILNILQKNGCPVVAITCSSSNTLAKLADFSLPVSTRESLFRSGAMASRITQLYIVDILYALCCSIDYDNAKEMVLKTRISTK